MNQLDTIFQLKRAQVAEDKKTQSIDFFIENFNQKRNSGNFFSTLDGNRRNFKIIAETKKGSPSAGIIKEQYEPLSIAQSYEEKGYGNISVLTESEYFYGANSDLTKIASNTNLKVLRKDFIFDEWQIYESKYIGADCILLIAEYLSEAQISAFIKLAKSLDIDVLLEFHEEQELNKVLNQELDHIGINNRNLKTLQTDHMHALKLYNKYRNDFQRFSIIAESGLSNSKDLEIYQNEGINKFLIGEGILKGLL